LKSFMTIKFSSSSFILIFKKKGPIKILYPMHSVLIGKF
jgi:hypothetical protein